MPTLARRGLLLADSLRFIGLLLQASILSNLQSQSSANLETNLEELNTEKASRTSLQSRISSLPVGTLTLVPSRVGETAVMSLLSTVVSCYVRVGLEAAVVSS